jgi:cysteine synthase A
MGCRDWVVGAIGKIEADIARSADTHLIPMSVPGMPGIAIYLKDETTHLTGSLKHRLARSLFLYALSSGYIHEGTTVVEASSGSTAISEAYFARLIGVPYIAVVPTSTSQAKIEAIEFYGGSCHFVENAGDVYDAAHKLAHQTNGYYMDQFSNAGVATDWRGNNNIAESIFRQMDREQHPVPKWIVVGAGTGGTSATIGRYIRYRGACTALCVVDPERSVFYDAYHGPKADPCCDECPDTVVEGIGRPRVEPSFVPEVVDHMLRVPNAASYAGSHFLEKVTGRRYGGSTGTNLYGVMQIAAEMHASGEQGSIVTLACDCGTRYNDSVFNSEWLSARHVNVVPFMEQLEHVYTTGEWLPVPTCGIRQPAGD